MRGKRHRSVARQPVLRPALNRWVEARGAGTPARARADRTAGASFVPRGCRSQLAGDRASTADRSATLNRQATGVFPALGSPDVSPCGHRIESGQWSDAVRPGRRVAELAAHAPTPRSVGPGTPRRVVQAPVQGRIWRVVNGEFLEVCDGAILSCQRECREFKSHHQLL